MTKKPVAKKAKTPAKRPAAKKTPTVGTMKGGIVVGGKIQAGRDVIMGDQYNDLRQQVAQIATPVEFVARAQEVQKQITAIKQQPDLQPAQVETIEVVEGQVKQVIEEAQKLKPLPARINATLTGAKAVMDSLGDGVKSAIGLGAILGGLAQIALKLFGG